MAETVRSRLAAVVDSGSKSERALAAYMMGALAELPFDTAASLARKVGVSEPTVGRFCRALGYSSFRAFKDHLHQDLGEGPWLLADRLADMAGGGDEAEGAALDLEIAGLVSVHGLRRTDPWRRAVRRLAAAPRVFVAGFQTERGLAQYFANQLQYLRDGVILADGSAGNYAEVLATEARTTPQSALVIFEARRYSRLARLLAQEARGQGLGVTLVTDPFCTWGAAAADEVFFVTTQVGQFWDSTALMATLGNLLLNDICLELKDRVGTRLDRIARLYGGLTGHVGDPVTPVLK